MFDKKHRLAISLNIDAVVKGCPQIVEGKRGQIKRSLKEIKKQQNNKKKKQAKPKQN